MPLKHPPPYKALSYVWGSPVGDVPICCGVQELLITENCVAALRKIRHRMKSRMLWVDAICINQQSLDERNHQVALMGDIYSKASEVIIWLGEEILFSNFNMSLLIRCDWLISSKLPKWLRNYLLNNEFERLEGEYKVIQYIW